MRFLKLSSVLSVLPVFLYLVCFAAEDSVYHDVVRIHVIAHSDDEADQNIKIEVRDLILQKYSSALSVYHTKDEALCAAEAMLPEIEADVNAYLADRAEYTCTVSIDENYFPTKSYGEYSLPRGNYTARRSCGAELLVRALSAALPQRKCGRRGGSLLHKPRRQRRRLCAYARRKACL